MVNKKPEAASTTAEHEDNTEQLAREECARLARQLRLMENDKKAYLEESNAAINQQKKAIRALEEENRKLEAEIEAHKTLKTDIIEGAHLAKVLSLVDNLLELENDVTVETRTVQTVGKQLTFASSRLSKLRSRVELHQSAETQGISEFSNKEIDQKEFAAKKKLQTVTAQFDSIVAENGGMRQEIDKILKDNVRTMKRCKELEEVCEKNKTEIDELVEQATSAYDQREEAVAKSNALFDRNEKEKKQFVLEISELQRLIRHEEKLLDFMGTKNQDRIFLETDDERLSRLESAKEMTMDNALERYQENLNKLLTPESPNIQSLVGEYAQLWKDNIERFNYINELNNDLETLQADVENLREEIKTVATQTVERNKEKRAEMVRKQEELVELQAEFRTAKESVSLRKKLMEEVLQLIERIFYLTDFEDAKPVLELIGNERSEISLTNCTLYLNILETRIAEIFFLGRRGWSGKGTPRSPVKSRMKSASDVSGASALSTGGGIQQVRPKILISAQTLEDESFDDVFSEGGASSIVEEEPSPLKYNEMRGKLVGSISPLASRPASETDKELK